MPDAPALVLASRSPQRRAILERLGIEFCVRPTNVRELHRGDPAEVARENALSKARAAVRAEGPPEAVLGVDTLVCLDGEIFGKPADERQARSTLKALAGATHTVVSGLAVILPDDATLTATAVTAVTFRPISPALLDWYLDTGEWRSRAGGYAIQGAGAALVRAIDGDYENVVGLPVAALLDLYPVLLPPRRTGPGGVADHPA